MGDGWKRAILATLATNTWTVKGEGSEDPPRTLTGPQVVALYKAIERMDAGPYKAIDPSLTGYKDRRCDRALQILRKKGLICYDKPSRTWVVT